MPTVHQIKFPTSNAFLLIGTKTILIDCGSFMNFSALEKHLRRIGIPIADIALLVITHVHFDHAGLAAKIKNISGCKVAVHELEKSLLEGGKNAAMTPIHPLGKMINRNSA